MPSWRLAAAGVILLCTTAAGFGGLAEPARAGSDAQSADAPAVCPHQLVGTSSGRAAGAVRLHVINEHMTNLELLYFDGNAEKRYWVIDAFGSFDIGTRHNDRWRLRRKNGDLVAEIRVGSDGEQSVTVPPCVADAHLPDVLAAQKHDYLGPPPTSAELEACSPWQHLSSSEPSPGLHVVCLLPAPEGAADYAALLAVFADGWTGGARQATRPPPSHSFLLPRGTARDSVEAIARFVMTRLGSARRGPQHQAPAIYTPSAARLGDASEVLSAPCVFVFEGGLWLWPAVEVGHKLELTVDDGERQRNVSLETVSLFPRVLMASDVITEEEAKLIMTRADGHMHKSGVSLKAADAGRKSEDYRTSSQWSFPLWDEQILALDRRVQQITRIPMTHAEQIQVLRYMPWEHYTAHHDFFDPGEYTGRDREGGYARNRLATVFFYLNEVEEGGETGFPRANRLGQPHDFLDCTRGLAVRPKRLAVLLFYSMLPNGEFDQTSLHTGCDVKVGIKWAANFWFWNQPQTSRFWSGTPGRLAEELANRSRLHFEHAGIGALSKL